MKDINWHSVIKSNTLLLLHYTLCVQCYTTGREASYVITVVLAARCTHLLVCLHESLYHSDYMANWIVYRKLNRTGAAPFDPWCWTCCKVRAAVIALMLFSVLWGGLEAKKKLWNALPPSTAATRSPVQDVFVYALGSMSHVSGTHTSIALFLFLPSALWYLPLLIKIHAHTSLLMYQPGFKL